MGSFCVAQDEAALAIIRGVVSARDEFSLTGLHGSTTGTLAVLGLAVADGALDVAGAAAAGHLDELFKVSYMGCDAEATARWGATKRTRVGGDISRSASC